MPSFKIFSSAICALLIACKSEPRAPQLPDALAVFPNLPLPPNPAFVSKAGSADALQITIFSGSETSQVVDYYRDMLSRGAWRLVSDAKRSDGSVVLYAEDHGRPLWIRIYPTSDRAGTMVELAGAVVAR